MWRTHEWYVVCDKLYKMYILRGKWLLLWLRVCPYSENKLQCVDLQVLRFGLGPKFRSTKLNLTRGTHGRIPESPRFRPRVLKGRRKAGSFFLLKLLKRQKAKSDWSITKVFRFNIINFCIDYMYTLPYRLKNLNPLLLRI